MIKEAIACVVEGQSLSENEMVDVMDQIMSGEATPAQIGAFITALRMKGETVAEITGAARVMRVHATSIKVGSTVDIDRDDINIDQETIVDTCGTGGSGTRSFNWVVFPEFGHDGEVATVMTTARDITSLRELEKKYQTLFEEMLDRFALHEIICDDGKPIDYRFLALNPAFENLTGLKADKIVG